MKAKITNKEGFKYASQTALHHKRIPNHLERIKNLKCFAEQYSCKKINSPAE